MSARRGRPAGLGTMLLSITMLALGAPPTPAQTINEVGSVLVYPTIITDLTTETFVTVSNSGPSTIGARLYLVDGSTCAWCDVTTLSLAGSDSAVLRFSRNESSGLTEIGPLDGSVTAFCPGQNGYAVIVGVDDTTGQASQDNVLLGNSIVRNAANGTASSTEAISFSARGSGNVDLNLDFDDLEYERFPLLVSGTGLAPDLGGGIDLSLSLFTLNYSRGVPPITDCTLTATDEVGESSSYPFQFGCWTNLDPLSISADLGYPNWRPGSAAIREKMFLTASCGVGGDQGGVHGAINQSIAGGSSIRRLDPAAPTMTTDAAWSRVVVQSVTIGDPFQFSMEICNGVDDDLDMVVDEGCDLDGDGFCELQQQGCSNFGDCDDGNDTVFTGAVELNDGIDNQCPGDAGHGLVDEVHGLVFPIPSDVDTLCWDPQPGVTMYELVRNLDPTMPPTCVSTDSEGPCMTDGYTPPPGSTAYYLVRAATPFPGSWSESSQGERATVCQ